MTTSIVTYQGDLRTAAVHLQSNKEIITDAPTDNQGKGEAFSPTVPKAMIPLTPSLIMVSTI